MARVLGENNLRTFSMRSPDGGEWSVWLQPFIGADGRTRLAMTGVILSMPTGTEAYLQVVEAMGPERFEAIYTVQERQRVERTAEKELLS